MHWNFDPVADIEGWNEAVPISVCKLFLGDGNILFLCIKHRYADRFHREGRQLGRKINVIYMQFTKPPL